MILDSFRLDGKVALVTGATRGIGQACALALAEAGADVAGLGRSSLGETEAAISPLGRRFLAIHADLGMTTVAEIRQIVSRVVSQLGRLDILINNAGIVRPSTALEFGEADWDDVIQVNLKSAFFLAQAAAQVMVKQGGGKIINIASMLSFQGGVTVPSYAAAKSGIAGLTRALCNEWARYNINVNAIAPGYVITEITDHLRSDPALDQAILSRVPVGRWATAADMGGATVFLASAAADYLHGAIVPVDGGWLAR